MKFSIIAVLAFVFLPNNLIAQAPEGAAKSSYKMFYVIIDRLSNLDYASQKGSFTGQLNSAETFLKKVKKAEPNFDTSKMEEDIEAYRKIKNGTLTSTPKKSSGGNINWDKSQVTNAIHDMKVAFKKSAVTNTPVDGITKEAEEKLAILKANHPDYDASAFEKEINEYKDTYVNNQNYRVEREKITASFNTKFEEIFINQPDFNKVKMFGEDRQDDAKAYIASYKAELDAFLNSDLAKYGKETTEQPAKKLIENAPYLQEAHYILDYYTPYSKDQALSDFYKIKLAEVWLDGMEKLFGSTTVVKRQRDRINEMLAYLKTPENAIAIGNANMNKDRASVKLLTEKMSNPALKSKVKIAVQKSSWGKGKNYQVLRIVSSDWQYYRHWLTGVVVYRRLSVQVVFKDADGDCILHNCYAIQEFDGNSYAPFYVDDSFERVMLCENVK